MKTMNTMFTLRIQTDRSEQIVQTLIDATENGIWSVYTVCYNYFGHIYM